MPEAISCTCTTRSKAFFHWSLTDEIDCNAVEGGFRCRLTQESLQGGDIEKICREHESSDPENLDFMPPESAGYQISPARGWRSRPVMPSNV
ncbi:MAG: hypothetical protein ABFS02_06150 [Pseudomonadota bacterium]